MYIGGFDTEDMTKSITLAPGFIGAMQQFILNGQECFVPIQSFLMKDHLTHNLNAISNLNLTDTDRLSSTGDI